MCKIFRSLAVASVFVLGISAANATTVSINFDDAGNGDKTYTSPDGFYFTPTNFDSSSHCDPAASGNGSCLAEKEQGVITTMTRPVGQSFSLLSFYFDLLGTGNAAQNSITVTGSNGASQTFSLGNLYNNVFTELPEDSTTTEKILKGNGYEAFFDTSPFDIFNNVTSIVWTAFPTANVRLDDIQVSYLKSGEVPPAVPLPAAGLLLMSALTGLGVMSRYRRTKSSAL